MIFIMNIAVNLQISNNKNDQKRWTNPSFFTIIFTRGGIMEKIVVNLEKIQELETRFKVNNYRGNISLASHSFMPGEYCSHILVGTPHSVKTTSRKLSTRDIVKAISLAKEDADNKAYEFSLSCPSPSELAKLKKITFEGREYSIFEIADVFQLNPHILRYYYNKTAVEEEKAEEVYTGAITLMMNDIVGCHVMVRNNYNDITASTNHYNPYLMEYIKENGIRYYVDVHGAALSSRFDIAPGMNDGEYIEHNELYRTILLDSFTKFDITNIMFNSKFQASTKHTLCNQVWTNCRIKTTQLEINKAYRSPLTDIEKTSALVSGLATYIEALERATAEEKRLDYGKVFRP